MEMAKTSGNACLIGVSEGKIYPHPPQPVEVDGYRYIYETGNSPYVWRVDYNKKTKRVHLGCYKTIEDAVAARDAFLKSEDTC